MSWTRPYHRHPTPTAFHVIRNHSDTGSVDLRYVHLPTYGAGYTVEEAVKRFDARTAECVRASTGDPASVVIGPIDVPDNLGYRRPLSLLSTHDNTAHGDPFPSTLCLAALAFTEYFPWDRSVDASKDLVSLKDRVSEAILNAVPQWCGTNGAPPSSDGYTGIVKGAEWPGEGNYDLDQMPLIVLAYRYYDYLTPAAQNYLVEVLLAQGGIYRHKIDIRSTSGAAPQDWALSGRASFLDHRVPETENHILQIHTARYLSNQLVYRPPGPDYDPDRDNRRNGRDGAPSCTELMLILLQNFLTDDFSEYNAKSYQIETRNALRNLCSYAYDHEVRLAARMVLDYLSARVAVSSCDLRRMVPFRRRNEDPNIANIDGVMDVSLLEWRSGADRAVEPFVVLTGNTRAFETCPNYGPVKNPTVYRVEPWKMQGSGDDGMLEGLSDYRLPALIHDLFVNDLHRRYLQYLHRTRTGDSDRTGQNADNYEIYAGSPSYLISAGGEPAGPALESDAIGTYYEPDSIYNSQLGVAVTTSFMPTGQSAGLNTQNYAADLIQFGSFSTWESFPFKNYGVAPDFACGYPIYLPSWAKKPTPTEQQYHKRSLNDYGSFSFLCRKNANGPGPGFFLAIYQDDTGLAAMEAYDTWLYPDLGFDTFAKKVFEMNANIDLRTNPSHWTMTRGDQLDFVINSGGIGDVGAWLSTAEYALTSHSEFLSGTVLNSDGTGVITISNPGTPQTIVLDMSDKWNPVRTSETGAVERGGGDTEVWVNFDYSGAQSGDFFQPFNTMSAAFAAVADQGVIKVLPGHSAERVVLGGKSVRIEAATGGVVIGA